MNVPNTYLNSKLVNVYEHDKYRECCSPKPACIFSSFTLLPFHQKGTLSVLLHRSFTNLLCYLCFQILV